MSILRRLSLLAALLIAAACGATPPAAVSPLPTAESRPSPSPTSGEPVGSPSPTAAASPSANPIEAPATPTPPAGTPTPAARPSPSFAPTPGSGSGWSGPGRVSERSYYDPSLAVDGGLTMMAYVAAGLNESIWFVTNDEGNVAGAWTRERLSRPPSGYVDEQPSIAIDEASGMFIAFTRMYDSELGRFPEGIYVLRRTDGGDWGPARLLIGDGAHSPSLVVRDGVLHLAYVQGAPSDVIEEDASFPLMYGTDRSGSFSSVEVAPNGADPELVLGSDGSVHVIFGSPWWAAGQGVSYARAPAGDGPFSLERLPGTTGDERQPALALDPSGRPHAAWNVWPEDAGQPSVQYARRTASGWSPGATVLPDVLLSSLVIDYLGGVHLAAGGESGVWYGYAPEGGAFATEQLSTEPALWLDLAPPVGPHGGPEVHLVFVSGRDDRADGLWYGVVRLD